MQILKSKSFIADTRDSQRGVTMVEYALAIAILFMAVVGIFQAIEANTQTRAKKSAAVTDPGPCGDLLSKDECK